MDILPKIRDTIVYFKVRISTLVYISFMCLGFVSIKHFERKTETITTILIWSEEVL